VLQDLRGTLPTDYRDRAPWIFKAFYSDCCLLDNFLSPNRREFYKIMLITSGSGMLTLGVNTYYIGNPVLLFVHPNEIISWKNLSQKLSAHYILFKTAFMAGCPQFKAMLDKFGIFQEGKSVICLRESEVQSISQYFERMEVEERLSSVYREDTIQALLQLLMVESMKVAQYPKPDEVLGEHTQIHQFFNLLEKETSGITNRSPIGIRTVKEFASSLHMHPNYLNALLKKHTGKNVSAHIRNRILEEAKALLLHTNWSLQNIAYSIGFSEQSNFNFFFKKNTGFTPAEFRRGRKANCQLTMHRFL
jgi:AraC family transcriptional activator of pobA